MRWGYPCIFQPSSTSQPLLRDLSHDTCTKKKYIKNDALIGFLRRLYWVGSKQTANSSPLLNSHYSKDLILTSSVLSSSRSSAIKNMDHLKKLSTVLCFLLLQFGVEGRGLSYSIYQKSCPQVEDIVRAALGPIFLSDPSSPPAFLRLLFHDCQVQVSFLWSYPPQAIH